MGEISLICYMAGSAFGCIHTIEKTFFNDFEMPNSRLEITYLSVFPHLFKFYKENFNFFFFFHCRLHPMMIPDLAVLSEDERSEALETSMERAQRKSADD